MRGMLPEDVYELTGAQDPRLSPDGRTVAYTVWWVDREESAYRSAIWLADVDGSRPPRRLTNGPKRDVAPRWSPDGTRIAFVSNRERDCPQLYVIPADGGEAQRLTDLPEAVETPAWSPDGTRIAFASRVRDEAGEEDDDERTRAPRRITTLSYKLDDVGWTAGRRTHLFVVPADGSAEPAQITDGDAEDSFPTWAPDGERIAFVSARHDDWDVVPASDVYVVAATGGDPERLTATDGSCAMPSWSPDGSSIAFCFVPGILDYPRHARLAVLDVATRERRTLTDDLDRNAMPYPALREPVWAGESLLFAVEDAGNTPLFLVRADGTAKPEVVLQGEMALTGYDLVAGVGVHSMTTPTTLSEVYAGDRRLTSVGDAFVAAREIVAPERFTARSADGTEVEAWIVRPAGFQPGTRYPLLLNIHGGPFTQYGNRLFDEFQVYAGAGYAVVYSNPRGSSGYSEEWGRAIRGPSNGAGPGWGTVDYEDVTAVVDEALRRFDFCDPDRVGVMGGSYGGFMTSWIVTRTDRFTAAISERAVNYFPSMFGSSDEGWSLAGYVGSMLWEDPEAWHRMSPLTSVERIHTPLLILHSEDDLRCDVEQAEQLFVALRLLRREVEMVRFPAEGHELSRSGSPAHRVQRFEVVLDWWRRHLAP